ncbi:MAG TPA: hypothetical protein VGX48_20245 [Pyrinomonadaceae bacterium]|nr:hypothetical protein [Pyrinomonadaceae bacterium]
MKVSTALLLCLLFAAAPAAQTRPPLERRGDFVFDAEERVLARKLTLDNRLVLVGRKAARSLDLAAAKLTDPRPFEIPDLDKKDKLSISPAGGRLLVVPSKSSRPAAVWDLESGKLLATLKPSRPVRAGFWSEDGSTLVTSSSAVAPFTVGSTSVEVAFWDAATLARLSTLPTDKVGWWQLTADGSRCFFSIGEGKNYLIVKLIRGPGTDVSVWDVRGGRVEQTVAAGGEDFILGVYVSPGERYLALLAQPPKSKDAERRLAVFEIDKTASRYVLKPRHEVRPAPQIPPVGAVFSPGAKYFAVDAGKRMQIYESASGGKKLELADFESPNGWLNDETFLRHFGGLMKAYDTATGKLLYEQKQVYNTYEYTEPSSYSSEGYTLGESRLVVNDETHIRVHPSGRTFLTYSNQYVKVFDTRTGGLLQELVAPPMDYTKKQPRLSDKTLVSEAGWSYDGRTLYVVGADGRTVSLWRLQDS